MRGLLDQLAKTKKEVERNAAHITDLQRQIGRLQKQGKDVSAIRKKLSQFHSVHLQVLAVQAKLQKALKDVAEE